MHSDFRWGPQGQISVGVGCVAGEAADGSRIFYNAGSGSGGQLGYVAFIGVAVVAGRSVAVDVFAGSVDGVLPLLFCRQNEGILVAMAVKAERSVHHYLVYDSLSGAGRE